MTRSHKFSWFNPKTPKKIYLEIGGERFEFEEDSNPKKLFDLLWNNATYYQVPILISRTKVKDLCMPLKKSCDRKAMSSNISEMVRAGHPQKQAVAAAYSACRAAKKHKKSGKRSGK